MPDDVPAIHAGPEVIQAVRTFLSQKGASQPIRIDLGFKGCCDASLRIVADRQYEDDISVDIDGVRFVINRDTYDITGDVMISLSEDKDRTGFSLTSSKPVSEWDGFGVCQIDS